ncbi:hypothetical protein WOLCODRAFT_137744 [Wolfiporia cocos MD-104 SS10]|uniref:Uncharacterized protein n=1 Tax=Wolfiporia cocos (strain MD-104) TaxID=742152 RepID=A0A2H3JQJ5_WOLCO|nr:hypothetical protein WOLCODRAFT_137744 [Wolfiporia cocos MD-104 SS10]
METLDPQILSELESLSDSDWLDIASSRASGDTDFDSDREDSAYSRPLSSRSSNDGSSRASEVHAWEGLIDEPAEEAADQTFTVETPLITRSTALSSDSTAPVLAAQDEPEDPEEERRVKDALDQSMMSTLSSSRSNSLNASSIVHPRDLRLSFPDPLVSSRETLLNTSYEDVSRPLEADSLDTDASIPAPDPDAAPAADPGAHAMPAVPEDEDEDAATVRTDFHIVLYGTSSAVKWSLIDKLLEKAAQGRGLRLTSKIFGLTDGYVRFLSSDEGRVSRTVSVIDRTNLLQADDASSFIPLDKPSLAVVFLPSSVSDLPEHTLYLPVLTQGFGVADVPHSADQLLDAEQHWETLGIPFGKVAPLATGQSAVLEQEEIDHASAKQIARALRPLFATADRKPAHKLPSKHAFTIFAVLSVVLGCVMKGSFSSSAAVPTSIQQRTASSAMWGLIRPMNSPVNHSLTVSTSSVVSSALISSSLKDFALAVLPSPLTASTSTAGARQSSAPLTPDAAHTVPVDAPSDCPCGCGLVTWPGKMEGSTDLIVRPTSSVAVLHAQADSSSLALLSAAPTHVGKGKGKATADESLYRLGTRLAEYIDWRAVAGAAARSVQELLDALDALTDAIGRQISALWGQSVRSAQGLRASLREKHGHARAKAQELRARGGRLVESVRQRVRGRVDTARDNARAVKEMGGFKRALDVWKAPRVREAFERRKLRGERERKAARKARPAHKK